MLLLLVLILEVLAGIVGRGALYRGRVRLMVAKDHYSGDSSSVKFKLKGFKRGREGEASPI